MRGENISEDLRHEWYSIYGKNRALLEEYQKEMKRLSGEIEGQLEVHQLYALERFVPCIVPPKGELRIGQAGGTTAIENVLARVREMPTRKFEQSKEILAQRVVEKLKGHLPAGFALDEGEAKQTVIATLEEARTMSDVDFELQKSELAQRFMAEFALSKEPVPVEVMIQRHLLDSHIIPLLEEKLGQF